MKVDEAVEAAVQGPSRDEGQFEEVKIMINGIAGAAATVRGDAATVGEDVKRVASKVGVIEQRITVRERC